MMVVEVKCDKKADSINALKNANKHLADLFSELDKKNAILNKTSSDLQHIARQCGDIQVQVYVGNNSSVVSLKTYLTTCAKLLDETR